MNRLHSPERVVKAGLCIGCGSCAGRALQQNVQMQFDAYGELKPQGPADWMYHSTENFRQTCPFSPAAVKEDALSATCFPEAEKRAPQAGRFYEAYVGHVAEKDFRMQGSSGGMVTWVATELLRKGLIDGVAHVVPVADPKTEGRHFTYRISRTEQEIAEGAKSRYYPVDLSGIIQTIRNVPGRYAVIGIPCFIKAVQLLRRNDPVYRERIKCTLGSFCGHMKSARFVESFAWQMKVPMGEVKAVEFRHKNPDRPANLYNAQLTLYDGSIVNRDWWGLADGDWGAGFFMNSACNFCDDVIAETADVSFGDAWVEPYSSDGRGTNVVVARSAFIAGMINEAIQQNRLCLETVDGGFVEQTQAAGLRQRREGLAYRLTWAADNFCIEKRVQPDAVQIKKERKTIYWMRYYISLWSHRVFWLAKRTRWPRLYISWARMALSLYHGLAYHKGSLKEIARRFTGLKYRQR